MSGDKDESTFNTLSSISSSSYDDPLTLAEEFPSLSETSAPIEANYRPFLLFLFYLNLLNPP
jgi:hypothetical protein